ncbi:MAG: hypothetical protein P8012_13100 [Desulfobacterales bacterium]
MGEKEEILNLLMEIIGEEGNYSRICLDGVWLELTFQNDDLTQLLVFMKRRNQYGSLYTF